MRLRFKHIAIAGLLAVATASCMKWDYGNEEDFDTRASGLFIINEGNFQYGNASLSFYDPATGTVENNIFYRANGMKLGDVAQSMTIRDNKAWIVVNHSHVVFAINPDTYKEVGRIENLTSPRYIHFISDTKAYITQLWDNRIFIVDPSRYEITGYIQVPDMDMENGSTEQMVQFGRYVFVTCCSYQNRVLKIDTQTDRIVAELTVGLQPNSIVLDHNNKLWVLCDGGYEGSPQGFEAPTLHRIDAETFTEERRFSFKKGSNPAELNIDGSGLNIYWINNDIWKMAVNSDRLPVKPLIRNRSTIFYGLTVNPVNDEVYVADAIDYQQQGVIYRYTADGDQADSFYAGIIPGAFCWK